jgi:hypothetical protein
MKQTAGHYSLTDIRVMDTSASPPLYYNMKKEADRLRTYDICPVSFVNKNDMAAAGFYFMGSEDRVRCPLCGVQVGRWEPGSQWS